MNLNHKWTEEREALLEKLWAEGVPSDLIARRLSTTTGAALDRRSVIGLPCRSPRGEWPDEAIETLRQKWAEGWSASQISGLLRGKTRNAVIGKLHRLGLTADNRNDGVTVVRKPYTFVKPRLALKAPRVARSAHPRPPRPGPQKKPALVLGMTFVEGPDSDAQRAAFRRDGLSMLERVISGAGVESPNARPFVEAAGGCKWPLGERHEVRLCCNPISRGVYCAGHAAVGYADDPRVESARKRETTIVRSLTRFDRVEEVVPVEAYEPEPLWGEAREAA